VLFVDTSFWVALRRRHDRRHESAVSLFEATRERPLLTSVLVLGELWTLVRRRGDHVEAVEAVSLIESSARVELPRIDHALEDEALAWLRVHDERPSSFVDATSFALMRKLRITGALAFDGDFAAAGFTELQP
jgi:uncharacterized protein